MGTKELKQQKHNTGLNLILAIALTAILLPALTGTVNAAPAIPDGDTNALRAAIASANSGDTIKLANNGTYILNGTPLNILGTITIQGQDATIDADGLGRVFNVAPSGDLTLDDLTITGRLTDSIGGSIYNGGTLYQNDSSTVLHNDPYDITP